MLQNIRDRFTGLFAALIIAAIGVALTITLVDTDSFTGVANFAARVNGEDIQLADFRQVAQQQVLEQQELTPAEMPEEARQQIERNVLEGMVRNRVVAQYVRSEGYRVSDRMVVDHIQSLPAFQVNGKFSIEAFVAVLASQGISRSTFDEERRAALQIEQLQNGVLESAFFTPAEYRRFVVLEGERRRAQVAVLDPQQLTAPVTVSDEEIQAFYDSHPDQFESQESVSLDFVEARLADFGAAGEATEADLRAVYEANPDRFTTAEQRRARHILVAVDQDTDDAAAVKLAADLRNRLDNNEDFASLARKYSDDPGSAQSGGELGWAGKGTYVEPFEAALFTQVVGEVSQPVKTTFGYHIIQLEEVRTGTRRTFDEVRQELADEASAKGSQDQFFTLTEKMDDAALENPGSLDAVAAATGLSVRRIEQFTRAGAEPFVGNSAIIDAVFSAAVIEDGENSPLVEAGDGRAVILRVIEHRPVKLRPLDEVRAEAEKAVRAEKLAQIAAERGRSILAQATSNADFASLATAAGATLVTGSQVLARNSQEAPAEVVAAIFHAARPVGGQPVLDGVVLPSGGYAAFRLEEVIPGNPDEIPLEQRDARKSILARQSAVAEVTSLAVDLRKDADVVIAPGLFDQQDTL